MAEHYRFFNSAQEDQREYLAADFAEYFARFLNDGLYTENGKAGLRVKPGDGFKVQAATGYAFIRGYLYHNDAPLTLTLEPADTMLDRIDRVVLRLDEVAREIRLAVKTGAFSSTPQAPGLEETSTVKELGLARVFVRHGTTSIPTGNITDERLTTACGLVSSIIEIPAQEMWDVWNAALDQIETAWDQQTTGIATAWQAQTDTIESAWQTQTGGIDVDWEAQSGAIGAAWEQIKDDWEAWFASIQQTLGLRVMVGEEEPPEMQAGDLWLKVV